MTKTEKGLKGFEGRINGMFKGVSQGLGLNLGALTKVGLIAAATKKLYDFGKASIDVASDLREVQNVVDTVFGDMSQDVDEFASNSVKQYGLATLSAKHHASSMGAMLKSSGIAGEAVRDMSLDLTALAADMASFYNLDNDVAFQKIMSGMSGMTQPLKELGINMNIANIEAFAMSQGVNKAWREMSQAEQTLWRYNYLLSVTGDAQGDFAKESGTWANQVKILKEQWKEFMGLIGTALVEVMLPIVKFLNQALEFLIKITKEIGKIYTMITGRKAVVETTSTLGEVASDAADGELELADGIDKAAKAAKKAVAPFDEINQLQDSIGGSGASGLAGAISSGGGLNTSMTTTKVDNGIEESKKEWEGFFVWIGDKWNGLKQTFAVPITVPAPIVEAPYFPPILSPVYEPNWGLETPKVEKPYFPPVLNPVYEPVWNLEPPTIPTPVMPGLDYSPLEESLNKMEMSTSRHLGKIQEGYKSHKKELSEIATETAKGINIETEKGLSTKTKSISLASTTDENNLNTHGINVGKIAAATGGVLAKGFAEGLTTKSKNTVTASTADERNLNTHGANVGSIASDTALAFALNLNKGYESSYLNTVNFANASIGAMNQLGDGMATSSGQAAEAINKNYSSGFAAAWDNFKEFASATGEKISGFFKANPWVGTTLKIAGAGALVATGIGLVAPAAMPYIATALGGLASIPAYAKGGITNGPHIAMVGDNPGGKEVISPLDGLLDMIIEAVSTTNNSGSREPVILQVNLEGREIARAVYDPLEDERDRRGNPVITTT